jgi:predicted esterase
VTDAREHRLEVTRTARYWTLGDTSAGQAREVWFVLHGYRQLAGRFIRRFQAIATAGRVVVAPEALSRFYIDHSEGAHGPESRVGATWMTREDRLSEIGDYVAYLDGLAERVGVVAGVGTEGSARPAPSVTVLGFSQGAHTAARWAALGHTPIGRIILWGAGLPHDPDMREHRDRLAGMTFVLVRGAQDGHHSRSTQERDAEVLRGVGIEPRLRTHDQGHRIDEGLLAVLAASPPDPRSG